VRLAIIHHAAEKAARIGHFLVADLCRAFEAAGHEIVYVSGPGSFRPADAALLHVDLSVVPQFYVALGRRYPLLLNGRITDIRKRRVSQAVLKPGEAYDGPVVVKSDLNHGGRPEWRLRRLLTGRLQPGSAETPPPSKFYRVFDSPGAVPAELRARRDLVVERFLPEKEGAYFFARQTFFFGDHHASWRVRGRDPILRAGTVIDDAVIATPPTVRDYARKIGLDYGKIDYVEHDGQAVVFDVNKTVGGVGRAPRTTAWLARAIGAIEAAAMKRAR